MTLEQAAERIGLVVRTGNTADGRRRMQWFVPWSHAGRPQPAAEPPVGTRTGLVLGYDHTGVSLRWPRGSDPWRAPDAARPAWGDLLIGPALP